jgi:serine/threonine protein kinase/WD40 repeat protein
MADSEPNMSPAQQREEALFAAALAKPKAERDVFVDGACYGDPALRARLEALLAAHDEADELLTTPDNSVRLRDDTLAEQAEKTLKVETAEELGDESVGQTLGRYKLLERVGEGGCGVVYVAEQTEPVRRRVALKVIKLGMDTKQVVARFEAERQALAMMDHPNIAKVLDAGATEAGRPYFVMELVRGIKITDYCDQNQLTAQDRVDLFIKVCQAIQHAHQKGIIHRDIKPSNILVTLHDGVPVPKVIDFGIAKATEGRLTDATVYTQLHQFIGTPAYMSPEQAEMSGLDIDTRSDIYSLGVLLYELLAGSTPFDTKELLAAGIDAMRKVIREKEPMRPSTRLATLKGEELTTTAKRRSCDAPKLIHLLRGDLDWIVMKCLEKDRTRRYETANGLAADLLRHLRNEPVIARPPSAAYRFQKLIKRNKLAFTVVGLVTAALVIGLGVSTWMFVLERFARQRAVTAEREQSRLRQEAQKAQANEAAQRQKVQEKSSQLAETLSRMDQQKINDVLTREPAMGLAYLARALRQNPENYRAAYRLLSFLSYRNVARLVSQRRFEGRVLDTSYRSLGPLILTAIGDGDVWLWDYRKEQPLAGPLHHTEMVQSAKFAPAGHHFLVSLADNKIEIWSTTNTLAPLCYLKSESNSYSPIFSPDEGKLLLNSQPEGTGSGMRVLQVYDVRSGQPLTPPVSYAAGWPSMNIGFTPDARRVVIDHFQGSERTRFTLDISTGKLGPKETRSNVSPFGAGPNDPVSDSNVPLRDGSFGRPYSALDEGRQFWLPLSNGSGNGQPLNPRQIFMRDLSLTPNERGLLTRFTDGTVGLWDVGPRSIIPARLDMPPRAVKGVESAPVPTFLELSADGRRLLMIDKARNPSVWDTTNGRLIGAHFGEAGTLSETRLSPDGQKVAVALTNGWIRLWDTVSGQPLTPPFRDNSGGTANKQNAAVRQLAFSRDGRRLAIGWANGVAQICNTADGKRLAEITAHRGPVSWLVFSPDGHLLATIGEDRTVGVWDTTTGSAVIPAIRQESFFTACQFSPDGKSLATISRDRTARLWDLRTGQALLRPLRHQDQIVDLAFQADGALVTISSDSDPRFQSARVWDASGTAQTLKPQTPSQMNYPIQVTSATMLPEGRFLLLNSYDGVRLWDTTTDTPLTEPIRLGHWPTFSQVEISSLSADGNTLAVLIGNEVRIWELPRVNGPVPDWLPRLAEILAGQRLTEQGLVESVAATDFLTVSRELLAGTQDDVYSRWARWFLADRMARSISPFSNTTLEEHIKRCLEANTASSALETVGLDRANPKTVEAYLQASGEGIISDVSSIRYALELANMVLETIPNSSPAWFIKAMVLARLNRGEEALAALARSNPGEVGGEYWFTKARLQELLARNEDAYASLTKAIEVAKDSSHPHLRDYYHERSRLLLLQNRLAEASTDNCLAQGIPFRDPGARSNLIDLSMLYTSSLTNIADLNAGNDVLSELPLGVHTLGEVKWDIRGLVHAPSYYGPNVVRLGEVPVNLRCGRLHFLQGATGAASSAAGLRLGQYTVHYADHQSREIPIRLGTAVWDWFYYPYQALASEAPVAWAA